jgi:hypothetical protein
MKSFLIYCLYVLSFLIVAHEVVESVPHTLPYSSAVAVLSDSVSYIDEMDQHDSWFKYYIDSAESVGGIDNDNSEPDVPDDMYNSVFYDNDASATEYNNQIDEYRELLHVYPTIIEVYGNLTVLHNIDDMVQHVSDLQAELDVHYDDIVDYIHNSQKSIKNMLQYTTFTKNRLANNFLIKELITVTPDEINITTRTYKFMDFY